MDYYPDEADQALSLPQKAYVSSMLCWKDPKYDAAIDKWLLDAYTKADKVAVGVYVADFNVRHRKPKVSIAGSVLHLRSLRLTTISRS
jgi:hypothetical protein